MAAGNAKQVLVTRVDDATHRRLSELLRRTTLALHYARWDSSTLELVEGTAFDVIIIGYPVSREALTRFLQSARAAGAACSRAGLVLITENEHSEAARALIGKGANRVITAAEVDTKLLSALEELAMPAPRVSVKMPARIQLFADGRPLRLMAQIQNLSASGMLLRGVTQFPVGTSFEFEMMLPDDPKPISGTAEITRTTEPMREPVQGVGVRFVSFEGSDRVRLEMFVDQHLPQRTSSA
jgi:CheY-like chemotaxis protein